MKNQKSSIDSIKKWNKILEKVWFWIAVVDNFQGVLTYFLLSGLAWGIYLVRRGIRIKLDKSSN